MNALPVALSLVFAMALPSQDHLVLLDGTTRTGAFALVGDHLVDSRDPSATFPMADVERLILGAAVVREPARQAAIIGRDDRLSWRSIALRGSMLRVEHDQFGALSIPVTAVRALFFRREADAVDLGRPGVGLVRGGFVPELECRDIGADQVRVAHPLLGTWQWERANLAYAVFPVGEPPPGLGVRIVTVAGDRLSGSLLTLDGAFVAVQPDWLEGGRTLQLRRSQLEQITFFGPRVRYPSDVALPDGAVERIASLPAMIPLFPGRNRDLRGGPLLCGGRQFANGYSGQATTRIRLDVQPGETWFRATVGPAPQNHRAVRMRVYAGDHAGDALFDVIMNPEDAPRSTGSLELGGARAVVIVVESARPDDATAVGVWADPIFIRP